MDEGSGDVTMLVFLGFAGMMAVAALFAGAAASPEGAPQEHWFPPAASPYPPPPPPAAPCPHPAPAALPPRPGPHGPHGPLDGPRCAQAYAPPAHGLQYAPSDAAGLAEPPSGSALLAEAFPDPLRSPDPPGCRV